MKQTPSPRAPPGASPRGPPPAAGGEGEQRSDNPVALKVMRLCRPSLGFGLPVPFETGPPKPTPADADFALSGMMMLPQSFGDIYLGETFSCYISMCNCSAVSLSNVGLKVEVQTQLQRETLSDSSKAESSIARFAPQQTLDRIIAYELRDVGIHILICSALYSDAYGEKKYFRKFFKFQVQNPLSMKSKTHALDGLGQLLVETQMHNATCAARNSRAICAILAGAHSLGASPTDPLCRPARRRSRVLFLQSVGFAAANPQLEVESLNDFGGGGVQLAAPGAAADADGAAGSAAAAGDVPASAHTTVGLPPFGQMAYLRPGDMQQYMFRLTWRGPPAALKSVGALGRMEVSWRGAMGERGHLQSNTVQRKLPAPRAVEVSVVSAPAAVALETPFGVRLSVANTTSKELTLQMRWDASPERTDGFVVDGVGCRDLGAFKPHATREIEVSLIALAPGIRKLGGLQLYDPASQQAHDAGQLADVYVEEPGAEPTAELAAVPPRLPVAPTADELEVAALEQKAAELVFGKGGSAAPPVNPVTPEATGSERRSIGYSI